MVKEKRINDRVLRDARPFIVRAIDSAYSGMKKSAIGLASVTLPLLATVMINGNQKAEADILPNNYSQTEEVQIIDVPYENPNNAFRLADKAREGQKDLENLATDHTEGKEKSNGRIIENTIPEDYVSPVQKVDSTLPKNYSLSQSGLDLIKRWEGFSQEVYKCQAGKPTIGFGHLIKPGESFDKITRERAEDLLRQDVGDAESAVKSLITAPLTQGQYDSLVSFTYNLGPRALETSTLRRKLNSGDYQGAAAEFDRWIHAAGKKSKGLINRRNAEEAMFLGN